ncbi:phosphatidylserine decarboxylase [Vulcanibacillus modesticaldus]|uniref:Phosphatidylserine decarboxylase proenzyme n=1 Tax=Vulcanibacillus modesticaldus TaxID=337097 RepID=A0A1D2YRY6_9BACI|nr:phosphatidylserine decarboxylase family protein [Vulcanibacillus modesticaldus]OEF96389.1 phosphatidylserine decarboxylase [Vulcanibacillus modesticaldus]
MKQHALLREGLPTLVVVISLTILLFLLNPWLSFFGIGLMMFVIYFFRDPKREIPADESVILAPADGLITNIDEVDENLFMQQKAIRISIFMSPMDVHINRSPISGKVSFIKYQKGKFMSATNPKSHDVNEKNYIGIKNDNFKILVVQIAGIMARRIVNWSSIDQVVKKGDKIGMIKFSSGTQVFLPVDTEISVKKGDKVISGITVIGRYPK